MFSSFKAAGVRKLLFSDKKENWGFGTWMVDWPLQETREHLYILLRFFSCVCLFVVVDSTSCCEPLHHGHFCYQIHPAYITGCVDVKVWIDKMFFNETNIQVQFQFQFQSLVNACHFGITMKITRLKKTITTRITRIMTRERKKNGLIRIPSYVVLAKTL